MRLTAVFSCVRVLAESVGMLPCNLYHLNGSLKQRATGERLHKLISTHPNGYMTPQEFWELVVTCLCLRGNFYAYKVKAFGEVAELLPVDPGCVVPKLNSSWEPVYQVTFPDGSTDVLSQEDIWHVRTLTLDGLVGLNPIAYAREAISLAAATEEHGARLFSNGAVTSGVLRTEQTLSDQAYERLKKDFEERHTGLGNAHRPMILEMGLDWKRTCASAPLDPLTRAVVISLFTWRRAEPDDNADVPMGWWGDTWPAVQNDRYGSRLWLLQRSKLTNQLVLTVRGYIRECLQWMIDDGVVSRIDLDIRRTGINELGNSITLWRRDGPVMISFDDLWSAITHGGQ
ncbi:phage portal protein [Escherichia coli]